jgi:aspartokinase/homoserine dehydrogenase 1
MMKVSNHEARRPFRILKFGGTSVSSASGMDVIRAQVEERLRSSRPIVVVSAFGGTTDALLGAARAAAAGETDGRLEEIAARQHAAVDRLLGPGARGLVTGIDVDLGELSRLLQGIGMLGECSPKTLDWVLSFGERISTRVVVAALRQRGLEAQRCDARGFMITDDRFGEARVDFAATADAARSHFETAPGVQVVTGFIGATRKGETTTLGRGASDYTASVLGAVLGAEAVEIWTDDPGVMSADPREVPGAFPLPELSYDELLELSHWGAKVMHAAAVRPLREKNIPLHIRSTMAPQDPGSLVSRDGGSSAARPVRGVASVDRAVLVQVEGAALSRASVLARMFSMSSGLAGSQLFVSQGSSERSVCFALRPDVAMTVIPALEDEFGLERRSGELEPFRVEEDSSIVTVVGEAMRRQPGTAGRVFGVLGNHGINIRAIAQGSSELSISFALGRDQRTSALRAIHDVFFAPRPRPAELFIAGVGRVGAELLGQLAAGAAERHRLVVAGISRRSGAVLDPSGIDLGRWRESLDAGSASLDALVEAALASGRHPRIFVDCSASPEPVAHYERLLRAGVAVVTANKVGFSSGLEVYRGFEAAAAEGARFYHETTVGAALPVLNTLRDLVATGDEIDSVDGVLSGSVGYVFDRVMAGVPFSRAVAEAHERGYTEPDPRDDLSGLDVARKLLILARQAGLPVELEEVVVEPVLPGEGWASLDLDAFWKRLPEVDAGFETRRMEGDAAGVRLVFLASLQGHRATVRLQTVGPEHPCWSLRGTENLVAIRSSRYREVPLVVRGPGAGPAVTAAGVMADVLRARSEASEVPTLVAGRSAATVSRPARRGGNDLLPVVPAAAASSAGARPSE